MDEYLFGPPVQLKTSAATVSIMGEIRQLPLKCPLCDGAGRVNGATGDPMRPVTSFTCTFCRGTGKRPTDEELAMRRAVSAGADHVV